MPVQSCFLAGRVESAKGNFGQAIKIWSRSAEIFRKTSGLFSVGISGVPAASGFLARRAPGRGTAVVDRTLARTVTGLLARHVPVRAGTCFPFASRGDETSPHAVDRPRRTRAQARTAAAGKGPVPRAGAVRAAASRQPRNGPPRRPAVTARRCGGRGALAGEAACAEPLAQEAVVTVRTGVDPATGADRARAYRRYPVCEQLQGLSGTFRPARGIPGRENPARPESLRVSEGDLNSPRTLTHCGSELQKRPISGVSGRSDRCACYLGFYGCLRPPLFTRCARGARRAQT